MKRSPQSSGPQGVAKDSRESKGQHWECAQHQIYQYFTQHLNVTSSIEKKKHHKQYKIQKHHKNTK
jgi:hypothetical protein